MDTTQWGVQMFPLMSSLFHAAAIAHSFVQHFDGERNCLGYESLMVQ